jgi:putative lipoprotein
LGLKIRIYGALLILSVLLINTLYPQDRKFSPNCNSSFSITTPYKNPAFSDKLTTPDKAQHFMGSLIFTVLFYKIFQDPLEIHKSNSKYLAVGITLGLGVSKELYDSSRSKGAFSWKDLLADVAGITVGLILVNQP